MLGTCLDFSPRVNPVRRGPREDHLPSSTAGLLPRANPVEDQEKMENLVSGSASNVLCVTRQPMSQYFVVPRHQTVGRPIDIAYQLRQAPVLY
jgi:hypothetical protein